MEYDTYVFLPILLLSGLSATVHNPIHRKCQPTTATTGISDLRFQIGSNILLLQPLKEGYG